MAEIIEYKCPNCDGIITFDSQSQKMKNRKEMSPWGLQI